MPHHTSDPICLLCEFKLKDAVPFMRDWFHRVKAKYENVHCSCSHRDAASQEQAYVDHKTHAHFPDSPHNRSNPDTKEPESYALDIFQIDEDGVARFSPKFYMMIAKEARDAKEPIKWGGDFRTLGDYDHFQYVPEPVSVA